MTRALAFAAAMFAIMPCALAHPIQSNTSLPIVELPYQLHQALAYNATGNYYQFANIRYAAPPTGDLRFRAPTKPAVDKSVVQNGSVDRICAQGIPTWQANTLGVVAEYFGGKPYTLDGYEAAISNASFSLPGINNGATEDCLFLDVYAPRAAFEKSQHNETASAPVLVWMHGGGFILGSKYDAGQYNPESLIANALLANPDEGLIFVALNYRLGALGWLGGPTLQSDGTANAGFYDQRMALDWVQDNIHLFGGDKARVTLMAESAGGGSLIGQLTAFGGVKAPFSQAIAQSPAGLPQPGTIQPERDLQTFLAFLNVTTLTEARALPSEAIIAANAEQIHGAPNGSYIFGATMDGDSMREASYGTSLKLGRYDPTVKLIVGHNINEGGFFADPSVKSEAAFAKFVSDTVQGLAPQALDHIVNVLYPPVFDGSYGYTDYFRRGSTFSAEIIFDCHARWLNQAYQNTSYSYEFSILPGLHTQDLDYTFAPYHGTKPKINVETAVALQQYITSFAVSGVPSSSINSREVFPMYGSGRRQMNLTAAGLIVGTSDINATRCDWWQQGLLN